MLRRRAFALSGLDGARMQAIVKRAGINEAHGLSSLRQQAGPLLRPCLQDQQASVGSYISSADVTGDPREAFGVAMTQVMGGLIERPLLSFSDASTKLLGGWRNMPAITLSEAPKSLTTLFKRARKEGAFRSDIRFESVYLAALGVDDRWVPVVRPLRSHAGQ